MTQLVVDRPVTRRAEAPVTRPRRSGRGSGRGLVPALRPTRGRPLARPVVTGAARSCVLPAPEAAPAASPRSAPASAWRLTERGVAVVLVGGLMIMVAALTVVGLTAARVTGEGYQTAVTQTLPR